MDHSGHSFQMLSENSVDSYQQLRQQLDQIDQIDRGQMDHSHPVQFVPTLIVLTACSYPILEHCTELQMNEH